ncbi:MAG: saccharopine dehydrogenase C-terminal domain-containing protein [archaeon]|nr:saccharopine dehydrogenase C-terminal domain-containing protein [archaeon]
MAFDFVVLGATGMQGKIVSRDLLEKGYSVLMCGRDKGRIEKILKKYKKTEFEYFNAENVEEMAEILKNSGSDIVINCVEGDWNLNILNACVMAEVHSIDLGSELWMTKKQFKMDKQLKEKNLLHITGAGSVPGIGNVMLKYAAEKFDKLDTIEVGFAWSSNMKEFVVPFSIESIMWEFTQPAPFINKCKFMTKTPMHTVSNEYYKEIGKEETFFVVHPEPYTFYKYFKHQGVKNIRFYAGFPHHSFEKIKTLIELGFSSYKEIDFQGMKIAPAEFLTAVLKQLKMPEGYKEKENLWVDVYGTKNGKKKKILMECLVPTLKGWEDAGCNVDTGLPASIMAQMIKDGTIKERGCFAPEGIVPPEPFFAELRKKKMKVFNNGKIIN